VLRSTVAVPVPEAGPATDSWKERTGLGKPSIGIPAHVTLVFPFVPAEEVNEALIAELRGFFTKQPAFDLVLARFGRFPETIYLAPEPPEPFVRMTEALMERYPDHPPYEGVFDTIVPHLTVAHGDEALLDEAERDVRPHLPIRAHASEALLLVEVEPDWGRWETRARFRLSS